MINYALLQMDIVFENPKDNRAHVKDLFAKAMTKTPRPDVVVLPEDWTTGFSVDMYHNILKYMEPENGPSITILKDLAKQYHVWIVGGSLMTTHADGKRRSTTFLINREGEIVGDYSKMHLYSAFDEDMAFEHGNKSAVFNIELGRLGFMICYDIRFCELSRIYALKKANTIVVTSNFQYPRLNHWRTLLIARAIETQSYVVACNRVGSTPMQEYFGHSLIIDPWGEIIAEGSVNEEIVTGSVNLKKVDEVRNLIPVLKDRRPNTYGSILSDPLEK